MKNVITLINEETGQIWTNNDFEDYYDEYFGRLLKIPEEILKTGAISLVFDTNVSDVINIKEYYLYDISCTWGTENGNVYEKGQEIPLKISIDGIDNSSFVVYAIFEKNEKAAEQIVPDKIYSGQQVADVKIYGSSLDENKLDTFSGVKMLLDTQDNSYQTSVAFENAGDYKVYVYGESEKGFVLSDALEFSVTNTDETQVNNQGFDWKNKIFSYIHMLWELIMALPVWGKVILVVVVLVVLKIISKALSFIFYREEDEEADEDDF